MIRPDNPETVLIRHFHAGCPPLGSACAARADDGTFAVVTFFRTCMSIDVAVLRAFRRGRRHVHARARALPE